MKKRKLKLLNTKYIFVISVLTFIVTILMVWLFGIENNRSLLQNAFWSCSILAGLFFVLITYGLYKGVKLKDNLGSITDRFDRNTLADLTPEIPEIDGLELPDLGDDFGGVIIGLLLWLLATCLFFILFYCLGTFLYVGILVFMGMLYWVFFRALRLVFKQSPICKNDLLKSISYASLYTFLYCFWFYGILFIMEKHII